MFSVILASIIGYMLGSVPFGLVVTRWAGLGDIRQIGSGNIGATNVLRTGRKDLALFTLIFDIGKAGLAAALCRWIFQSESIGLTAGFMAVVGHNYPIWLGFKGGKGVASTLGMMFVMTPFVGVLTALTWLAMAVAFRYSSLAALTALALSPLYAWIWATPAAAACYGLLALLSWYRHRGNIRRLIEGQESKINLKGKKHEAIN